MEADFSGYATKAGLKCSDGRTIMPGAFAHQDKMQVPLVWQHGHTDPENVLGHAILEHREDGVYAYGFFNESAKAKHVAGLLEHKDITQMSIWANDLIERAKRVMHGAIREVSLVLSAANPGALIDSVTIRHSDGDLEEIEDEAIIYTGLDLDKINISHAENPDQKSEDVKSEDGTSNADTSEPGQDATISNTKDGGEESIKDIYDTMNEKQKEVLHYMLGEALSVSEQEVKPEVKPEDVIEIKAGASVKEEDAKQDNTTIDQKGQAMTHNVFEKGAEGSSPKHTLTHSEIEGIVSDATKMGSMKDAVEAYAIQHGITDIDLMFPEAQTLTSAPEMDKRRTEWVAKVLSGARKSPFTRIKTISADLTIEEARARGYVTGAMKKDEYFGVKSRVTTPTTIYKKQKLDRDDMLDITDFDVVAWLKSEMRLMLDEELARAILFGDGRDVAHEDKINELNIRPIATDHSLYATTVSVNLDDAGSSIQEVIDAIVQNRKYFKGTGLPTMFTTETHISSILLLKDTVGRRIYKNLDELAGELRVQEIVPVEAMEGVDDIVAILVNMNDYNVGADAGGQISMFDDFDIDYNQHKYLIETRVSGALAKLKSALVIRKIAAGLTAATPGTPSFDGSDVTIVNQTGVIYKNAATGNVINAAGSPYEVQAGGSFVVEAEADTGYYFPTTVGTNWTFLNTASA